MSDLKVQTDPSKIDWDGIQYDVSRKIFYLRSMMNGVPEGLREKFMADLVLPNVKLLAQFCTNIEEVD